MKNYQSPQNRYENDPQYHQVCDAMEKLIHEAHLTPSEMRECAVLACIHYELRYGLNHYLQSVPWNCLLYTSDAADE